MTALEELRERVRILEDIQAIIHLRNKYFRCLDGKLWDEIAECFTEDVKTSYFNGEIKVDGREALVNFFKVGVHNRAQRIAGVYQDEYVKEDRQWKIKSIVCNQIFQENWDNKDIPSLQLTIRGTLQYAATPSWRNE